MKLSDKYYTGREVQKILGITEPALRNLVNQKKIKKSIPPGRKYGVYLRSEIDRFAEKWEAFLMAKEPPKTTFKLARKEDMKEQEELDARSIGPGGVSAEILKTWLDANDETCFHVFHEKELVAFALFLPLQQEIIEQLLQGKIHWEDLDPQKDIDKFEEGRVTNLYIYAIASDLQLDEVTRQHYTYILLRGIGEHLKELGQRGIIIKKIYGLSSTPTGIAMALHMGMQEYKPRPRTGKTIRFELDIDQTNTFLARLYKDGLAEWNNKKPSNKPRSQAKQTNKPASSTL